MNQYFKREAESDFGAGIVYIEITDGWPSRQVEIYGDTWRWADELHREWLADQPLEYLDLEAKFAISAQEFEEIWQEARQRCPQRS